MAFLLLVQGRPMRWIDELLCHFVEVSSLHVKGLNDVHHNEVYGSKIQPSVI